MEEWKKESELFLCHKFSADKLVLLLGEKVFYFTLSQLPTLQL